MARSRTKRKKKTQTGSAFDLEALGLVLLAVGIFLLGLLVPLVPTGEWGRSLRSLATARVGWGAYVLPWPFLVLGALFLLRRNPKGWPRVLAGYLVFALGLWCLAMLAYPGVTGRWGAALRGYLAGAAGLLAYVPALFIATLGLDLLLGWTPTRLTRVLSRGSVDGVRRGFKGFMATRAKWKKKAAFRADVALARRDLNDLDKDLQALEGLYPGSAEVGKWRKSVAVSLKQLKKPTSAKLADIDHDLHAWQGAVADFARDRAKELSVYLRGEGVPDFSALVKRIKASFDDPVTESGPPAKALDGVRKTLALDLTALAERHRRALRERDLADAALKDMRPRDLVKASDEHNKRVELYRHFAADAAALETYADTLEPWRSLVGKHARLRAEFSAEELADYGETLAKELRSKGREVLVQLAGWQQALDSAELKARAGPIPGDVEFEAELEADTSPREEAGEDFADESGADVDETMGLEAVPTDPLDPLELLDDENEPQPAIPAVGGIPIQLPATDLLEAAQRHGEDPALLAKEVQARVRKIDETLANFGLTGRVVASVRGPTVTRFEVEPAPGEKISRFANLSDDLALAMAVGSVRIEAPIPGKSVIGLEVPNANRDLIRFREAAEAGGFKRSRARLPLILGKSIDGDMVVADLARMPHLLIAGSTGSGKSVAVNTLVGSLLYKFLPTELRFLMIDPKMVELTPFDGIPHMLQPVVTNPNDASGVLLGAVAHMERRYKMMSKIGAKNLDQYNEKARNLDMPEMPFIVIIIDELADLMITSPKEVESAIMRLAQMARATGMHLILATQRPSVDILTSLIKVNVPARMAFAVSSSHDSRTILDSMGAERLIGMGDMLFYQPGMVKAARLQGPYIDESEIAALSAFLRRQYFDDDFGEAYGTDFDPPSLHESEASGLIDWNDDKLREAAELVINEGQGSVSRLQRRLSVGHARAGKLMDSLEALGVVGGHVGSKPRDVLVDMDELPNIFGK